MSVNVVRSSTAFASERCVQVSGLPAPNLPLLLLPPAGMAFYATSPPSVRHNSNSSIDLCTATTAGHQPIDYRMSSLGGGGGDGGGDCEDNASSGSDASTELDDGGMVMNGHTYRQNSTVVSSPAYKQIRYIEITTLFSPIYLNLIDVI